ncbi:MAG TPA: hypothetical protein VGH70_02745 [Bradyrhizobium sp.]|jgi:hypothetical protein
MSQKATGILAALAVSLAFGAVQFASGHDLTVGLATPGDPAAPGINRAAKADREAVLPEATIATRTISIHVDKVPDTSVLVRIPLTHQARVTPPAPLFLRSHESKNAVACEPSVSVLTEIAKRLQPGRCIT